jgi:hypothetical protein
MEMNQWDVAFCAAKIADELFRMGDEPDSRTQRISFIGGRYTTDHSEEREQGGLSRSAFEAWLASALDRHFNSGDHGGT